MRKNSLPPQSPWWFGSTREALIMWGGALILCVITMLFAWATH